MNTPYRNTLRALLFGTVLIVMAACASIGNPSGGPRDEQPPRFVRSNPAPGSTNFKGEVVNIYFDELVNVKDAFTKVVVSPPSDQTPRVSSQGRQVSVRFPDTLIANTTYTIDFGNAIEDNNESNQLDNFSFTFSTGDHIDTLGISGMVLSSFNLEPLQGAFVGVHSNLNDSAFHKLRFDRVSRTDDCGRFSIAGLAPGKYRVFALVDGDADMRYSSPEEEIAFYDVVVEPTARTEIVSDTVWNLKEERVDTVVPRRRTVLLPNDILLRSFVSRFKQQYITKYERQDTTRILLTFNSPSDTPATYSVIGAPRLKEWAVEERSSDNDTVTLWLRNPALVSADTLRLAVNYLKTDSTLRSVPVSDTLRFVFDRKNHVRLSEQKRKDLLKELRKQYHESADSALAAQESMPSLITFEALGGTTRDINKPLNLQISMPPDRLDTLAFHLDMKKDSLWIPIKAPLPVLPDSARPRLLRIDYPWEFGASYRLRIDSLAAESIYGDGSAPLSFEFKMRPESDYSSLTLNISGLDPGVQSFVELLQNDNPIEKVTVENGRAVFPYLQPGKYYLRVYEDFNGNGVYDPGDYDAGVRPDLVYYYPKQVTLKKNWSKEESWDVFGTPVNLQKPSAILQNRPAQKKGQRLQQTAEGEEDEESDYFGNGSNSYGGNNPYGNIRRR